MPLHELTYDIDVFSYPPLPKMSNEVLAKMPAFEKGDRTVRFLRIRQSFQRSSNKEVTRSMIVSPSQGSGARRRLFRHAST